jgi:PAS domain S-box-containing protein
MLRDTEYRILVEQAPMIIWRADADAKCDYFNDRWLAFTGRTLEQELGDGWTDGVHSDDLPRCIQVYLDAFARRETFEMEYRLRRHDGEYRWILDRGTPSYDGAGTFRGYIGSCVDVTERVRATAELRRRNEEELRRAQALIPVCFGCKKIRDDAGYWLAVDRYLADHAGRRVTHGLCETCLERLYPDVARQMREAR